MPTPPLDLSPKAEAILIGALEVFTQDGYAAASMDRIAAAAKVSKPTLYSYFQDKEGLFVALIRRLTQTATQQLLALQDTQDPQLQTDPPEMVLRRLAHAVLDVFLQERSLCTMMRLIIGESERFPDLSKAFLRGIEIPVLEALTHYFTAHPELNLPDPKGAAYVFAGSIVFYLLIQKVLHGEEDYPMAAEGVIDSLIAALTTAPPATPLDSSSLSR